MKAVISRVVMTTGLILFFLSSYAQKGTIGNYKFVNGIIEGFTRCNVESISVKAINRLNKEIKKNISHEDDTVMYQINADKLVCAGFISKYWEGTYVFVNNSGKIVQEIVYVNPEGKEYNSIYNQLAEKEYSIAEIEFPQGPIRKIITSSKVWYEVVVLQPTGETHETLLLFDKRLKQIGSYKAI